MELGLSLAIVNGGTSPALFAIDAGSNELSDTEGTVNILVDTEGSPNELTDTF